MSITAEQIAAGRAFARVSIDELAKEVGVAAGTISYIESGKTTNPKKQTLEKIKKALEAKGVEFTSKGGVQPWQDKLEIEGPEAIQAFYDDVVKALKDTGGEVLMTGVDESKYDQERLAKHIEEAQQHDIRGKLLIREGDTNYADGSVYRWLPEDYVGDDAMAIYGDRYAILQPDENGENHRVVIKRDAAVVDTLKKNFYNIWDNAKKPEG